MQKILEIEKGSIAEELGIFPGATVISINGKPIHDLLDYRFYVSGEKLEVLIKQNEERKIFEIEKDYQEDLGLILDDLKMRKCGNHCVFCFVHQNPKGLRKSLYFKDEDYRFSFLFGHYVTLSNTTQSDLNRIVEQRLSPLYVSVHVTDPELRKYMLGIKFDDLLLEKIKFLTDNGIELHCQIVLCPGLNDGRYLERTINDLRKFYPGIRSIAIVPVGLTKHRKNLPQLKPVTLRYSMDLMDDIDKKRRKLRSEVGSSFIYLSDELFVRTGIDIPSNDYYEQFYQLENGVGLTRDFCDRFEAEVPKLKKRNPCMKLTFVSGNLGTAVLKKYVIAKLQELPGLCIDLLEVKNDFFGESVGVSGLLVGQDIYNTLKDRTLSEYVILPPRVLNHDQIFLDDWTIDELEKKLNRKIFIFPDSFCKLFDNIVLQKKMKNEDKTRQIRHGGTNLYHAGDKKVGEEWFQKAIGK
jgi:putative radical SAM enzyme (TIGR03279 family)